MTNIKHNRQVWEFWLSAAAWVACVIPTLIVGIIKFPMIATPNPDSTISGTFALVLIIAIYPIFKGLSVLFKNPSIAVFMWIAYGVLWLIYQFVATTLLALMSVCLTAAIGNTIGAILFWVVELLKAQDVAENKKDGDTA